MASAQREQKTPYYAITLTAGGDSIESLAVDSLGHSEFKPGALFPPAEQAAAHEQPEWKFSFAQRSFTAENSYRVGSSSLPMTLRFNPVVTHATLLALVANRQANLPGVLYLPNQGAFRIEVASHKPVLVGYDAHRRGNGYVEVSFPAATAENPHIAYTFTVVDIYPKLAVIDSDPRFDGFRRDYLNSLQVQAEMGVLGNHSGSDACAFALHFYSEVARYAPPLAPGLTAMDLVRMTLDRYLAGVLAYGMPGYPMFDSPTGEIAGYKTFAADSYPSILIAAGDYVETTHDTAWLQKSYKGLRGWTDAMLATDTNGDGLVKYITSGDAGDWTVRPDGYPVQRPANWWDVINFGYEDAYSNALAYHALCQMVELASLAGHADDAARYRERAEKLKAAYVPTFLDPQTGILAGWRSRDGKLHDYYFLWVNGAAVAYGLVDDKLGNDIFDHLLAKMRAVGYSNFELGLPGNLIPIRREDYVHPDPRWGGSTKEDGSDGFQIYGNGGATAAFAFYTVAALYRLGRVEDGDRILLPMLKAVKNGEFEGRGPNGLTYDWKAWDGTPHGYEGFLTDNYMILAALMLRPKDAPLPQP